MGSAGVQTEETPSGVRRIERLPTVTALVGACEAGPVGEPRRIASEAEFEATFGASGDFALAVSLYFQNGGREAWIVRTASPAAPTDWDLTFLALDRVEGLCLLVAPGETDRGVQVRLLDYAERRGAFVILDPPAEVADAAAAQLWLDAAPGLRRANAAAYVPRLLAPGQGGEPPRAVANSGAIAGVYVRTDSERGVWKAPAGKDATIVGVLGLVDPPGAAEADRLNAEGIDVLRTFPVYGTVVWGGRTLAGGDALGSDWKYVSVRRTALMIERSLDAGTQWAVFRSNDEPLWAALRLSIGGFMQALFRDGALQGSTPQQAYFVALGSATMTQADIDQGRLVGQVGLALVKPAEFVVLRFSHKMTGQDA
jgi:uncharacterized protein